jgi:hypothetical protein
MLRSDKVGGGGWNPVRRPTDNVAQLAGEDVATMGRLRLSQSRMTNVHHVVSKERLLTLDLFEKSFEQVPRIEQADRPSVSIQDSPGHDGRDGCLAFAFWAAADVADHTGLADDADHSSVGIASDQKIRVGLE